MKKYILFIAAAALMLGSCKHENLYLPEEPVHGAITVEGASSIEIGAPAQGADYSVKVESSQDWKVSGICDWVSLSKTEGKSGDSIKFTVAPSASEKDQKATFKVFSADAVATVIINQSAAKFIKLAGEETSFSTSSDKGEVVVSVVTNLDKFDFDFSGAEWLTFTKAEPFLDKMMLTFAIDRSKDVKERVASVKVSGQGVEVPVSFDLKQAQRDTVIVTTEKSVVTDLTAQDVTYTFLSNVNYSYSLPSWLAKTGGERSEIDPDTNLSTETLTVHADAVGGSRAAIVNFQYDGKTLNFIYFKQQNPSPVFAEITGKELKQQLESSGWILEDPTTGKCEVLEAGMNATELTFGSSSTYTFPTYEAISGLGAFPKLTKVIFKNFVSPSIDLGDCKSLTAWDATNVATGYVDLGDNEITNMTFTKVSGLYYCGVSEAIVIKGSKIKTLDASVKSYYINNDNTKTLDISGCPSVTSVNCKRVDYYGGDVDKLNTLYVSASQKAAIDGGSLTVTKCEKTEITVK